MKRVSAVLFVAILLTARLHAGPPKIAKLALTDRRAAAAMVDEAVKKIKRAQATKPGLIGVDQSIDELVTAIEPWLFNWEETPDYPRVIGLWGTPSTGKSSVVRRLFEELGLGHRVQTLDVKDLVSRPEQAQAVRNFLTELGTDLNDEVPSTPHAAEDVQYLKKIVILNEFQDARTLDENGNTETHPAMLPFWDVLGDDGITWVNNVDYDATKTAIREVKTDEDKRLLAEDLERIPRQLKVDLRNVLFIIIGNVPPDLVGGRDFNPETMTAQDLHQRTADMTLADFRSMVLARWFHPRDLSRLGSRHILFHSLDSAGVHKYIASYLRGFHQKARARSFEIAVDESLKAALEESIYNPNLGPRDFLPTLDQAFKNVLPDLENHLQSQGPVRRRAGTRVRWAMELSSDGSQILWHCRSRRGVPPLVLNSPWGSLKADRKLSEMTIQHITVHEAGHAIVSIATTGVIPSLIRVGSQQSSVGGHTRLNDDSGLLIASLTREQALRRMSTALAGLAAEKLVFKDATLGSGADMGTANQIVLTLASSGLLSETDWVTPELIRKLDPLARQLANDRMYSKTDELLGAGYAEATQILQREIIFFRHLCAELYEKRVLNRNRILQLFKTHWTEGELKRTVLARRGKTCTEALFLKFIEGS